MNAPSLRELQGRFWQAVATRPGRLEAAAELLAVSEPSPTLDAAGRLQVYADAYFWRLRGVLAEDFPRTAALLGPERFETLAGDYLRRHPSAHPSLRHLGDALPGFLARALPSLPHLTDLARLERARTDVFDAADDTPLATEDLRRVAPGDWPRIRFLPVRALRIVQLDWPVLALWDDDAAVPAAPAPTAVRVWRGADHRVFHAGLDARAARALGSILAGEPFAVVCAAFGDLPADEGSRLAIGLLGRWLADGLIARLA
jgi:hypothetical protein